MGNQQLQSANPLFTNWKPHPNIANVFQELNTHQQVERYLVAMDGSEEPVMQKRASQSYQYISRVRCCVPVQNEHYNLNVGKERKFYVFTDRFLPIVETPESLAICVLKGFRRLTHNWGNMRVCSEMIGVNERNEVRVWINPNILINRVWREADSEADTISDISLILIKYDPEAANMIKSCTSINDGINKLHLNFPQGKTKQQLAIRSTKQTNEECPKFSDGESISKYSKKASKQKKQWKPYAPLKRSFVRDADPKAMPAYLTKFQKPMALNKYPKPKFLTESTININNISEQIGQIQESDQCNTSQPINEAKSLKRKFRPVEYRLPAEKKSTLAPPNSNAFLSHYLSPRGCIDRKDTPKTPNEQPNLVNYNRKSDLNQQFLRANRPSDITAGMKYQTFQPKPIGEFELGKNAFRHQRSNKKQKSGNLYPTQAVQSPRNPKNELNYWRSQKFLQNRFQTFKTVTTKRSNIFEAQPSLIVQEEEPRSTADLDVKPTADEDSNYENKRKMKLKLVNTLRQQLGGVLESAQDTDFKTVPLKEKSMKDLLIHQKVMQKRKNFAQLKSETLKILND